MPFDQVSRLRRLATGIFWTRVLLVSSVGNYLLEGCMEDEYEELL